MPVWPHLSAERGHLSGTACAAGACVLPGFFRRRGFAGACSTRWENRREEKCRMPCAGAGMRQEGTAFRGRFFCAPVRIRQPLPEAWRRTRAGEPPYRRAGKGGRTFPGPPVGWPRTEIRAVLFVPGLARGIAIHALCRPRGGCSEEKRACAFGWDDIMGEVMGLRNSLRVNPGNSLSGFSSTEAHCLYPFFSVLHHDGQRKWNFSWCHSESAFIISGIVHEGMG